MRKQISCLEKEIMQRTMPVARRRGRPRTVWVDNVKTWTGLTMKESIRMAEVRDKWRKYVHKKIILFSFMFMVWPTLVLRMAEEQNSTVSS